MHMPQYAKYGSGKINCLSLRVLYVYTNIVQCSVGGLEIGRFLKKGYYVSFWYDFSPEKGWLLCTGPLPIVLFDDLLQPPGHGLDQGPQVQYCMGCCRTSSGPRAWWWWPAALPWSWPACPSAGSSSRPSSSRWGWGLGCCLASRSVRLACLCRLGRAEGKAAAGRSGRSAVDRILVIR